MRGLHGPGLFPLWDHNGLDGTWRADLARRCRLAAPGSPRRRAGDARGEKKKGRPPRTRGETAPGTPDQPRRHLREDPPRRPTTCPHDARASGTSKTRGSLAGSSQAAAASLCHLFASAPSRIGKWPRPVASRRRTCGLGVRALLASSGRLAEVGEAGDKSPGAVAEGDIVLEGGIGSVTGGETRRDGGVGVLYIRCRGRISTPRVCCLRHWSLAVPGKSQATHRGPQLWRPTRGRSTQHSVHTGKEGTGPCCDVSTLQGNLIVDDARHHSTFLLPTPAPTNFQKKKK